jgi:hypothetical protein
MVVGEPSLMGGEFGEEDERLISRLENTQYDPAAAAAQQAAQHAAAAAHHVSFKYNIQWCQSLLYLLYLL